MTSSIRRADLVDVIDTLGHLSWRLRSLRLMGESPRLTADERDAFAVVLDDADRILDTARVKTGKALAALG